MNEAIDVFRSFIQSSIVSGVDGRAATPTRRSQPQVNVETTITSAEIVPTTATDESYTLSISTQTSKTRGRQSGTTSTSVTIKAASFFGARHALETLSQLMAWDESIDSMIMLQGANITDSPAFPHRGFTC